MKFVKWVSIIIVSCLLLLFRNRFFILHKFFFSLVFTETFYESFLMSSEGYCLPTVQNAIEMRKRTYSDLASYLLAKSTFCILSWRIFEAFTVWWQTNHHILDLVVAKIELSCTDSLFKYLAVVLIHLVKSNQPCLWPTLKQIHLSLLFDFLDEPFVKLFIKDDLTIFL